MDPTQPSPQRDAGLPSKEPARAERGLIPVGAADPLESSRPGPMLAYVRHAEPAEKPRSVWPRRMMLIIFVVFCMEVGIMLFVLPWKQLWIENPLVLGMPGLRSFLSNYFVRGLFSGLGLVDLYIGIWEAVHYREN